MMDWFVVITKAFWCGCAATGFGILLNAPMKSLLPIWIGGFAAGFGKFLCLDAAIGAGVIMSSFLGAIFAGIIAVPFGIRRSIPHIIIALPSVIPLVPGVFAYRSMMGLMKLAKQTGSEYSILMSETVYNGVMAFFVVMAITIGLSIPLFITRIRFINSLLRRNTAPR